ncbi:MAG: hypothetical protein IPQ01_17940 [Zoogloea sp.]|nr:hypothetical protein [Zoogloea sp.]
MGATGPNSSRSSRTPTCCERKADVVQVVERIVKVLLSHPGHLPPKRKDEAGHHRRRPRSFARDTIESFKEHAVVS